MYENDVTERYFPKALAVDPSGCGCTECLIGEYVPSETWFALATPEDVKALLDSEVGNNTYYGLEDLLQSYNYNRSETKEFLREFESYRQSDEALRDMYTSWHVSH